MKRPTKNWHISHSCAKMELTSHLRDQQRWKKHAYTYFVDLFSTKPIEKIKLCGDYPIGDSKEYRERGFESA